MLKRAHRSGSAWALEVVVRALRHRTMEAGMRSEQVYWVFTVTVDQMDKFNALMSCQFLAPVAAGVEKFLQ
jgi:hypothetical protein